MIDWTNAEAMVSAHFSVEECLLLHTWRRLADETDVLDDTVKANLVQACGVFDKVRDFLGLPMLVHSIYRPAAYSTLVGGSGHDVHTLGLAIDFDLGPAMSIEDAKAKLEPKLEEFNIRMEKGTTTWIHLDIRAPGPSGRYFTP